MEPEGYVNWVGKYMIWASEMCWDGSYLFYKQLQSINKEFDSENPTIGINEEGFLERRDWFKFEYEYAGNRIAVEMIQDWLYSNVSIELLLNDPMIFNEFFFKMNKDTYEITEVWGVVPEFTEVVVLVY